MISLMLCVCVFPLFTVSVSTNKKEKPRCPLDHTEVCCVGLHFSIQLVTTESSRTTFQITVCICVHISWLTLIVEAVYSVNRGALVVSSQQKEVFWVFDLVSQQQTDGLQGLLASVYVVAQEQVVALWWKASIFKQPEQIIVLPVNIT